MHSMNDSHIDTTRLENIRHRGDDVISACPACREMGKDTAGDNLRVYSGGPFNCIAHPKDREHNRRIFALVGVRGTMPRLDPVEQYQQRVRYARERQRAQDLAELQHAARVHRATVISRWAWDPADVWEDSPQRIDQPLVSQDPRWFIQSLFSPDSVVWTGDVRHSGTRHADRWRTVMQWMDAPPGTVGPMIAPCTWPPGTVSRTGQNVLSSPFVVLDFDGFDGHKPATPAEIEKHIAASLALVRWLRDGQHWRLAALVHTGGKSVHAWFHSPPTAVVQSLKAPADALGIDQTLIGHPAHPCRLPGQRHEKTANLSRVLWLQLPTKPQSRTPTPPPP